MNVNNFVQVVEMTPEEKFEMYMKVPHEDLVRMKIEEERVLNQLEKELKKYIECIYTPITFNGTGITTID